MGVEHVGRIVVLNDTQTNVESGEGGLSEIIIGIDNENDLMGFSVDGGANWVWIEGELNTDEKIKISANDTTAGYLISKLVAGTNITLTENSDGGNETITIGSTVESSEILMDDDDPRNMLYDDDGDLVYE